MAEPLRVLDLFSGIGGFSLGLERTGGFKTVAFCEIEEFPRRVLAKHWPDVPIHRDVRELRAEHVGAVDVICGGYPCQPESVAGKRAGAADDRYLWPEMHRLVDECRPSWVCGENVAGHISMGLGGVLSDLAASGYAVRAFVIPAVAIGAVHRRDRVWIIAHAERDGLQEREHVGGVDPRTDEQHARRPALGVPSPQDVADAECGVGSLGWPPRRDGRLDECLSRLAGWEIAYQPVLDGSDYGIPNRVDRLRSLGNAVVPQIPEIIGRAILMAEGLAAPAVLASARATNESEGTPQ